MYLQNKYTKCYYNIVSRAKSRELPPGLYSEKHHIIPRSLGGNNSKNNIVALTAREHFICHLLLTKMTSGKYKIKMVHAAWRMCCRSNTDRRDYKITSSVYENLKIKRSEYLKSKKGPDHPLFGKKTGRTSEDFTDIWKENISNSCKGRIPWNLGIQRDTETRSKISATRKIRAQDPNWNIRPRCSYEKAQKIKEANLGKRWVHNKETNERKYVSQNDFVILCLIGWMPGRGPKNKRL